MNAWSPMISFSQSGPSSCHSFLGLVCWGHTLLFPWEDSPVTMHLPRMVKGIRAPHHDCPQWDAETKCRTKCWDLWRFWSQKNPSCPQNMHRTLPGVASGETFNSFSLVRDPCLSSLLGLKRMASDHTGCWKPVCALSLRAVVLSLQLLQQGHQNTDCWAPPSVFLNQQVWAAPLMTCISEQNPTGYDC